MKNRKFDSRKFFGKFVDWVKWGVACTVGALVGYFVADSLQIINEFLVLVLVALIILVIVEMVRAHEGCSTRSRWVVFYFLVYSNIIWGLNELVFKGADTWNILLLSLVVGFITSVFIVLIKELKLNSRSLPWAIIVLALILLVGNFGSISILSVSTLTNKTFSAGGLSQEETKSCPSLGSPGLVIEAEKFDSLQWMQVLSGSLLNSQVWRVENDVRACYKGKYKDQYPEWIYCDDLIVSRWEKSSSGTIDFRWYTAVSVEWKPVAEGGSSRYVLEGFRCENGQKVVVEKGVTNYYVYDSRDGSQIKIIY